VPFLAMQFGDSSCRVGSDRDDATSVESEAGGLTFSQTCPTIILSLSFLNEESPMSARRLGFVLLSVLVPASASAQNWSFDARAIGMGGVGRNWQSGDQDDR